MLLGLVVLVIGLVDKAYEEGQSKPSSNHLTKSQALCLLLAVLAAAIGALAGVANEKCARVRPCARAPLAGLATPLVGVPPPCLPFPPSIPRPLRGMISARRLSTQRRS